MSSLNWPSLDDVRTMNLYFLAIDTCIYSIEKNHSKSKHSNALHLFFLDVCFRNAKLIATRFSRFRINRHAATRRHRLSWTLTCIQQKFHYWTSVFWYYLLTWQANVHMFSKCDMSPLIRTVIDTCNQQLMRYWTPATRQISPCLQPAHKSRIIGSQNQFAVLPMRHGAIIFYSSAAFCWWWFYYRFTTTFISYVLIYWRRKRSAKASRTNGASPSMEPFSLLSDSIKRRMCYISQF